MLYTLRYSGLIAALAVSLSGCMGTVPSDGQRTALAGASLRAALADKTLILTPIGPGSERVSERRVMLRADGTGAFVQAGQIIPTRWSVNRQELCFTVSGQSMEASECRTIGWIEGDRFGVFDMSGAEPVQTVAGRITAIE